MTEIDRPFGKHVNYVPILHAEANLYEEKNASAKCEVCGGQSQFVLAISFHQGGYREKHLCGIHAGGYQGAQPRA